MVTRYGTAELFGYNFSGLTPQKIREFSAAHYKEIPCPFKPIVPGRPTPTCGNGRDLEFLFQRFSAGPTSARLARNDSCLSFKSRFQQLAAGAKRWRASSTRLFGNLWVR